MKLTARENIMYGICADFEKAHTILSRLERKNITKIFLLQEFNLKSENFVQLFTTHKTKFLSLDPSLGDQKWFTNVKIAARSTEIGRAVYESVKGKLIKLFDGCESITNMGCSAFDRCTRLISMSMLKTGRKTGNGCTYTVLSQKKGGGNPKIIYRKMFGKGLLATMTDKHQLCNTGSFFVQSYITS